MIIKKTDAHIEIMRRAGKVVGDTLKMLEKEIRPGISTEDLDKLAEDFILSSGARPAFKGYRGFPATACISIDEEVVHGIPGRRILTEGQIVSVDLGAIVDGFYGDAAETFPVGEISVEKRKLLEVTRRSLEVGIEQVCPGNRLGMVSSAIQKVAEEAGYSVVRELTGHGIGKTMHEDPLVPNYGSPEEGPILERGFVIAIEPMVNMGTYQVVTKPDGWTIVTADGKPSAHFEHTVAVTDKGHDILTL